MTTKEIYTDIKMRINLSPFAEYMLKKYLRCLDGEVIINDLPDEEEE